MTRFDRFVMRRFAHGFETGRILMPLVVVMIILVLAFALVMRIVDSKDYPTYGKAVWFATQTVTTVGYGDVTPVTNAGRLVAAILMILGFAFLSVVTGTLASALVSRTTGHHTAELERRIAELEGRAENRR